MRDAGDRADIVGVRSARDGRIPLFSHPNGSKPVISAEDLALQCQGGHPQRIWLGTNLNAGFDLCERALPLDKNNIRALGILALEYLLWSNNGWSANLRRRPSNRTLSFGLVSTGFGFEKWSA